MAFTEDQIKNLKLLLKVQSDSYNDAIDRFYQDVKEIRKEYEAKMFEFQKSLEFFEKDNTDMKKELQELRKENDQLKYKVDLNKNEIHQMQKVQKEMEDKIDLLDDKSRKSNLVLSGVAESNNENNEQCQKKVTDLLKDKFEISNPDLNEVFRIGKPGQERSRDILIRFNSINQRDTVIQKKSNLKGQNFFINEDFCKRTKEIRKSLMPQVYEARNRGMYAYINYRQIISKPLRTNNNRSNNSGPSRVQEAVSAIESTESTGSSPLPSPYRQPTTPCTPLPQRIGENTSHDNNEQRAYLRLRGTIKYSK